MSDTQPAAPQAAPAPSSPAPTAAPAVPAPAIAPAARVAPSVLPTPATLTPKDVDADTLPLWETTPAEPPPAPPPAEAKPAEPAPDTSLTQAHADLAKREAAVLEARRAIKAQEARIARLTRIEALAKSDPEALLAELGTSYEGVTNHFLEKGQAATPEKLAHEALARIQAFEKQQAEFQRQRDVEAGLSRVRAHVTAAGEKFEHINSPLGEALNAHNAILQRAAAYWQENQTPPDLDAIAAEVEKEIEDRFAKPVLGLKRYAPKVAPPPVTAAPANVSYGASAKIGSPTLSSRTLADGPNGTPQRLPLDAEERDRVMNADPRYRIWE